MVQVSFLEIYAERVFDLLTGPRPKNVEDSGEDPAKHARLLGLKGQGATRSDPSVPFLHGSAPRTPK